MALVLADRVRETTNTTGTSSFALAGSVPGFRTFSSVMANSDTTYYAAVTTSGSSWEVGIGTYTTSTNTLTRSTILSSSNSGAIVSFGTGAKYVFITQPSERAVYSVGTNIVSNNGATVPNSLLANSSITINGNTVSLGGSTTITAAAPYALTIGTGLSGTSYNGSAAVTIALNTVTTALGGTGLTSYTAGDITYYASGTTFTKLGIGTNGQILTSSGTAPQWTTNLTTAQGGTGLTTFTAGDIPYYVSGTALSKLGIGTNGQVLTSNGTAPVWSAASSVSVTTISFGTTGLTPSTATAGAVTVAGTLNLANGGTGATTVAGAQTNLQVDPAGTAVAMAIALG